MAGKQKDPDLNLLSSSDHGILGELNELYFVVKPQRFVIHLNIKSLNQRFTEF